MGTEIGDVGSANQILPMWRTLSRAKLRYVIISATINSFVPSLVTAEQLWVQRQVFSRSFVLILASIERIARIWSFWKSVCRWALKGDIGSHVSNRRCPRPWISSSWSPNRSRSSSCFCIRQTSDTRSEVRRTPRDLSWATSRIYPSGCHENSRPEREVQTSGGLERKTGWSCCGCWNSVWGSCIRVYSRRLSQDSRRKRTFNFVDGVNA